MKRLRGEHGSVAGMLIIVLFISLGFGGLAVDGTRLFLARRDLQALADSAALAAASSLDEAQFRATAGDQVRLEPQIARFAAAAVVVTSPWPADGRGSVEVVGDRVTVHLERPVRLTFLGILGLGSQVIGAKASASPAVG